MLCHIKQMTQLFSSYSESFLNKLHNVNVETVSLSPIVKNYLQSVLQHRKYCLEIYCCVLENVVKVAEKKPEQINLLDYGCGNGLLALFAKHCGFAKVYACDYNNDFVEATIALGRQLNIELDSCFSCNEYDLLQQCKSLQLHTIVGTDIIEHIYNPDIFLKNIYDLNANMVTVFTTASVHDNYFKRKKLYHLMQQDEFVGGSISDFNTQNPLNRLPYVEIRKKIIQQYFPQLPESDIATLAKNTRGLRYDDIIKYVTDNNASLPIHPYNTCDPLTGNFTERILTTKQYKQLYWNNGFNVKISAGFYNNNNTLSGFVKQLINKLIALTKGTIIGRILTPFIVLTAKGKNT